MGNFNKMFRPSTSFRWLNCTASVMKIENESPVETSSFSAKEGTFAHTICDLCLKNNVDANYYLIHKDEIPVSEIDYCEVMCNNVQIYVDYVRNLGENIISEVALDYSHYVPSGSGVSDCIVLNGNIINIIDFKYGKYVKVTAKFNPQCALYGIGALKMFENNKTIEGVKFHIVQPRINNIDVHFMTVDELLSFGEFAKAKSDQALTDEAIFNPSESVCAWCPVKRSCDAYSAFKHKDILNFFGF